MSKSTSFCLSAAILSLPAYLFDFQHFSKFTQYSIATLALGSLLIGIAFIFLEYKE